MFSRVLTLQPAGGTGTLRAELDKGASAALPSGSEAWFALPKQAVMPLSESLPSGATAPALRGEPAKG